jgi:hypothetical protein
LKCVFKSDKLMLEKGKLFEKIGRKAMGLRDINSKAARLPRLINPQTSLLGFDFEFSEDFF